MRILAVEDNPLDARLLREHFRDAGAAPTLDCVQRLSDALEQLARQTYDVVLLDLSLPDATGPETVMQVHAAAPSLPIVVLTGLDDEAAALRAVKEGAQDYLVKGQFEGALLLRAIRYAVERKHAEEQSLKLLREQQARAEAEERASQARLVADISRVLVSSVDYRQTVPEVATLALPLLGDLCVIDALDAAGERQRIAAAHADPELEPLMAELKAAGTRHDGQAVSGRAARSAEPVILAPLQDAELAALFGRDQLPLLHRLRPHSAMVLPMVVRDRLIGALTFARCSSERPYSQVELAIGSELASRVALAIENSQLVRAREDMLSIVSHDLRTPLSVISLSAGALSLERGSPELRARQLAKIHRSVQEMSRLIEDLLDVARIEAGGLPIAISQIAVTDLVDETLDRLRPVAEGRDVRLHATPGGPPAVLADRERCLQVFSNLVGNALKFTPAGGEVRLSVDADGGYARFAVRDTGPGIREEDLPRLFDRFWQGAREHRRGAGLGLAIARGIVQAHGGRIWVDSRYGEGTTFYFTVPVAETRSAALP